MKLKSVSFYQAVSLGDGRQHNTVYEARGNDIKYKGVEIHFKNGMVVVTGKDCPTWKTENREKVYFVGITNVRGMETDAESVKGTPFEEYLPKGEAPTRKEMMDYLKGRGKKIANNVKNESLEVMYKSEKEVENGEEENK